MFGRFQVRQRVVRLQHVALGREGKFGDRAIAYAQVELNRGFRTAAQHMAYCGGYRPAAG